MGIRLKSEKINSVLDRAAEGGSLEKIAAEIGVASKTVWELMKDFPLWNFQRVKDKEDRRGYKR